MLVIFDVITQLKYLRDGKFFYLILVLEYGTTMDEYVKQIQASESIRDTVNSNRYKNNSDSLHRYISLSLFTDGGMLTNSTKLQVWPLLGSVLELPPGMRRSEKNLLWYSYGKNCCFYVNSI